MKKIVAILLCFSILYSTMEKIALIVQYEVNINYYSTVLCEKKGTADEDCKGKCFLSKELKALEKRQKSPVYPTKGKQEIVQYMPVLVNYQLNPFLETELCDEQCAYYVPMAAQEVSFAIFHPPSIV